MAGNLRGREAFEAWAREEGVDLLRRNGSYVYSDTQKAWLGWLAACRACAEACMAREQTLGEARFANIACADACRALGDEG